jgi:tetratricopeptide (TPR) repeat protein
LATGKLTATSLNLSRGDPLGQATTLMRAGDWQGARDVLTHALAEQATGSSAWLKLAVCQIKLGDFIAATRSLEGCIEANPADADAHNLLGEILMLFESFDLARARFEEAARLDPTGPARGNLQTLDRNARRSARTVVKTADLPDPAGPGPWPTISACLIVKDEEANLARCLGSVRHVVDEIVVVDTGSTDRTVEIARQYGARVFHFPWINDFAAARNESLRHVTGDWVLTLDADFFVPRESAHRIVKAVRSGLADAFAYTVRSRAVAGGSLNQLVFLFKRVPGIRWEGDVHERVLPSLQRLGLRLSPTDILVEHTGYEDAEILAEKGRKYLALLEARRDAGEDNPHLHRHLAQSYLSAARYDDAIAEITKSLSRASSLEVGGLSYDYEQLAMAHLLAGRHADAREICERAVKLCPEACALWYAGAWASVETGRVRQAIEYAERARELSQRVSWLAAGATVSEADMHSLLARCYYASGQTARALDHCEQALALKPGDHKLVATATRLRALVEQRAAVILAIESVCQSAPESAGFRRILARVRGADTPTDSEPSSADDARELLAAVETMDAGPAAARMCLLAASILDGASRPDDALAAARLAADKAPDMIDTRLALGLALAASAETQNDAVEQLGAALELDPVCLPALSALGYIALNLHAYDEAVDFYGRAIRVKPDAPDLYRGLAGALQQLGHTEDAQACWLYAEQVAASAC